MNKLKKRLLNLSIGEFAATCVFIYIYISSSLITIGIANLIAFLYLVFILIQGSIYWFYKYRLIVKREQPNPKAVKLLSNLRKLNMVIALAIILTIPIIKSNYKDLLIAIGLVLFGIIEYINYYWYQLSYGASGFNIKILLDKGLQKSSIAKTIDKKS